jgi:glycosyltransferase involved in cell wall biosynthesis
MVSLSLLDCQKLVDFNVIIVDNDATGSAQAVVRELSAELDYLVSYTIEPQRGLTYARNTALDLGMYAEAIAFLDDDEEADPAWLNELVNAIRDYSADIVTGPVLSRFSNPPAGWIVAGGFFDRPRPLTGTILDVARTGNVLIRTEVLKKTGIRFDHRFAFSGGEDADFFRRLHATGAKIVASGEAIAYEAVPASRANVGWLLRRALRIANCDAHFLLDRSPSPLTRIGLIAVGCGRIVKHAGTSVMSPLLPRHVAVRHLQGICRGLGACMAGIGLRFNEYKYPNSASGPADVVARDDVVEQRVHETPLISAIIPTRDRAQLVTRAVRSALDQTYSNIEVIVVVDGPDPTTVTALAEFSDLAATARLRVVVLPENKGGSIARNAGVESARGEWIAFLDDDDEWLPGKVAAQLRIALGSRYQTPILSSRFIARTPIADFVWPRRFPQPREHISDYLFSRRSFFQGEAYMVTPTLFTKREFLLRVPFQSLKKHQDWDWVLRASTYSGVGFEFANDPLTICYMEEKRPGTSYSDDWRFSLEWAESMRGQKMITARAYACFIATQVAPQAGRQGQWQAFPLLVRMMITRGAPNARDLALFLAMWSLPIGFRRAVRKAIG